MSYFIITITEYEGDWNHSQIRYQEICSSFQLAEKRLVRAIVGIVNTDGYMDNVDEKTDFVSDESTTEESFDWEKVYNHYLQLKETDGSHDHFLLKWAVDLHPQSEDTRCFFYNWIIYPASITDNENCPLQPMISADKCVNCKYEREFTGDRI